MMLEEALERIWGLSDHGHFHFVTNLTFCLNVKPYELLKN